ncbi:hypothetical protein [Pseudoclavibacter sp. AY1H1]|uniref:hypothetical protein n=1 Tax=Pseudoclavibacter sp. AY1H1 TaxID=2080584 RepID=UPI000CE84566|nr:hypothetical protein [Pseudoclavibacter sp. AY1H1]PPF39973.1 hypothetical protein C5E05_01810 [Pseudoclavibacter sp. AY1H1]
MKKPFKPNKRGMAALLKQGMRGAVAEQGRAIQGRAGPGFDMQVNVGTRARATIMTETDAAKRRQVSDHVLEQAAGAGLT